MRARPWLERRGLSSLIPFRAPIFVDLALCGDHIPPALCRSALPSGDRRSSGLGARSFEDRGWRRSFLETKTFAELGLSPKVQAAIVAAGYATPTPIQAAAIPIAVTGRDVLGIAQTGTGKTASFVLPMITRLETGRARARMPRSLILAPTRELAAQCAQSFEKYGINHKLDVALLDRRRVDGRPGQEARPRRRRADRDAGTPSRSLPARPHHADGRRDPRHRRSRPHARHGLHSRHREDLQAAAAPAPDARSSPRPCRPRSPVSSISSSKTRCASRWQSPRPPPRPSPSASSTVRTSEDWAKREMLRQLIASEQVRNAIIFCNRKRDVAILLKSLLKHGFNAGALHGDMDQIGANRDAR